MFVPSIPSGVQQPYRKTTAFRNHYLTQPDDLLRLTLTLNGSSSDVPLVGVNGFGRIGRAVFRRCLSRTDLRIVAVNHTALSMEHLLTAIRHDSTHGSCKEGWEVTVAPSDHPDMLKPTTNNPNPMALLYQGRLIHLFTERDPKKIDWSQAGAEYIMESTGKLTTREKAGQHIVFGKAKKVLISAPSKDVPNVVFGVNHTTYTGAEDILSNASCTTNCLAPIALVLNRAFGIETGMMTTVHASTSSQKVLDGFSTKDIRSGRSAMGNIIPATTGAAQAVVKVLPELAGKFHGISIRVPVTNVSLVDLTVTLSTPAASKEDLMAPFREAAERAPKLQSKAERLALANGSGDGALSPELPALKGVLGVSDEKLVSSDYLSTEQSSTIDVDASVMLNDRTAKIVAWYDNEVAFASRMCDLVVYMSKRYYLTSDMDDTKDLEKQHAYDVDVRAAPEVNGVYTDESDTAIDVHTKLKDGVQRQLRQRHAQMMAMAGAIGTGLFLGMGKSLVHAGPAGALLSYMTIGTVIWCMIYSLGEMICYAPISGGYIHMVERYVHPSAGFALGYVQWYSTVINLPAEIISAVIVIGFWTELTTAKTAGFLVMLSILSCAINLFGVRWFGESEFFFSMIKIFLIVGLIIGGLVVDLGGGPNHERMGFRYWRDPGAFAPYFVQGSTGKFLGWFYTLVQATYSFSGVEMLAISAGELDNPRLNAKKAVNKLFWRILIFYVLGVLIAGMLVPYNDPDLLQSTGTAAQSPFVIAFTRAGIKVLPSVINAAVLTSAWSAANTGVYSSSRMLYGMALRGQAPRIFARTTTRGLPVLAIVFSSLFTALSFMSLSSGGNTVLNWLTNLTSIAAFFAWGGICIAFLRWKAAMEAQGRDRSASQYLYLKWQPFYAYWAIAWCVIIVIFNGFYVFIKGQWDVSNFIISYLNIPIFFGLFLGHWLFTGRKPFPKAHEIDLVSNIPGPEVDVDHNPPTTAMGRFWNWLL
nr:glyceraldehyde-3-phosphate dehydrogenase, type I [Kwoniella shandongensis]KAA5524479.1 glyceraldehyde-3-phosphate dehydrogenase, type I [Kwoniella shandongensis]